MGCKNEEGGVVTRDPGAMEWSGSSTKRGLGSASISSAWVGPPGSAWAGDKRWPQRCQQVDSRSNA